MSFTCAGMSHLMTLKDFLSFLYVNNVLNVRVEVGWKAITASEFTTKLSGWNVYSVKMKQCAEWVCPEWWRWSIGLRGSVLSSGDETEWWRWNKALSGRILISVCWRNACLEPWTHTMWHSSGLHVCDLRMWLSGCPQADGNKAWLLFPFFPLSHSAQCITAPQNSL